MSYGMFGILFSPSLKPYGESEFWFEKLHRLFFALSGLVLTQQHIKQASSIWLWAPNAVSIDVYWRVRCFVKTEGGAFGDGNHLHGRGLHHRAAQLFPSNET